MERVLAIVVLVVVIWWAVPFIAHGQWFAPTGIAPNSWVTGYDTTGLAAAASTPTEGYGVFHFDFWNNSSPQGRPVTKNDFRLEKPY